ncbi:lasso RiPP family leader peptide-containing protein [Streptomyces marispadix]|uniref:Lasso RiPP family leader peptide-containing protein n=1 Tax=Streptomyces marispadix TaxID=2922868 RepID=A0ABS9SXN5_9ACTN|nr:lasso RiPP family leader peptide-containing protein [Streptomyces marispadix]MCH6161040.1 lasso RiPP family leader peptide-containing protein [Streptomyces marispadix]
MNTSEFLTSEGVAEYEAPVITDIGEFAEQTRGEFGDWPDYPVGLWL